MKDTRDIVLKVGESASLKSGFMTKIKLLFTGMPDKDTFSLAVNTTSGHASHAYNLFFPKNRRNLVLENRSIEVLMVTPDEIRLNILLRPKERLS